MPYLIYPYLLLVSSLVFIYFYEIVRTAQQIAGRSLSPRSPAAPRIVFLL